MRAKKIWGSDLIANEVGPMIVERFLPEAAAEDRYFVAPRAETAGTGLKKIPTALERQRLGVSVAGGDTMNVARMTAAAMTAAGATRGPVERALSHPATLTR